jgi:hypothetical protein
VSSSEVDCGTEGKRGVIPHVIFSTTFKQSSSEQLCNLSQVRIDKHHGGSEIPRPRRRELQLAESDAWSFTCQHSVELKPRAKHIACGQVVGEHLRSSPTLVCVEQDFTYSGYLCGSCFDVHDCSWY